MRSNNTNSDLNSISNSLQNFKFENNERFTLITNAQTAENIINSLKPFVLEQLQEYSRKGKRLYNIDQIRRKAQLGSKNTVTKYSKQILKQIFKSEAKALVIYKLIFGQITTTYSEIKIQCKNLGFILKTTPTEWFHLILTKGSRRVRELRVRIECIKRGHITYKLINNILYNPRRCYDCMILNWKKAPLSYQNALDLAGARGLTLMSFRNHKLELEEAEFNNLINQHLAIYSIGSYRRERWFIILKWKCDECKHIFDQVFYNIKRGTSHCPACRQSIQQRITYRIAKYIFKDYILNGDFDIDKKLYKLVPHVILGKKKYEEIKNKNVHIDISGKLIFPNNRQIKLGIEHHGQQHDRDLLIGYPVFKKISKETRSVQDWNQLLKRDFCKVDLYCELNKNDQYLIVVPWNIAPKDRYEYILRQFTQQTNLRIYIDFNPSPPPNDWKEIVWGKSKVAQSSYFRRLYPKNKI